LRYGPRGPGHLVEDRLGRATGRDRVRDPIGVTLPAITGRADAVRKRDAGPLLDRVGGLVRGEVNVGGLSKRDALTRRERERSHVLRRHAGLGAGLHTDRADIVATERSLDALEVRQRLTRATQTSLGLAVDRRATRASVRSDVGLGLNLLLLFTCGALGLHDDVLGRAVARAPGRGVVPSRAIHHLDVADGERPVVARGALLLHRRHGRLCLHPRLVLARRTLVLDRLAPRSDLATARAALLLNCSCPGRIAVVGSARAPRWLAARFPRWLAASVCTRVCVRVVDVCIGEVAVVVIVAIGPAVVVVLVSERAAWGRVGRGFDRLDGLGLFVQLVGRALAFALALRLVLELRSGLGL
jgi:hypothetical protein